MATYIQRSEALPFQRGRRGLPLQKNRSRRELRLGHVLALILLQALALLGVREAYLFAIRWDGFKVRTVEVECGREPLRRAIEGHFAAGGLGNILLLDLDLVGARVRGLGWVKDVRVRKVLPSTVRIEVLERTPFALARLGGLALLDEDGVVMERVGSEDEYALPVVSDEAGFGRGFREKWEAVRRLLREVAPAERERLLEVRTSDYGTLTLLFRDSPTRVVVDSSRPAEDLAFFRSREEEWTSRFGPLESVDLSSAGRVFIRPAEGEASAGPSSAKEAE
jgi:hypothetical protein